MLLLLYMGVQGKTSTANTQSHLRKTVYRICPMYFSFPYCISEGLHLLKFSIFDKITNE